jgi:hypothetical protein
MPGRRTVRRAFHPDRSPASWNHHRPFRRPDRQMGRRTTRPAGGGSLEASFGAGKDQIGNEPLVGTGGVPPGTGPEPPFDRTPVLAHDSRVNPQRGPTVERPERPLPSPAPDPRRSGQAPAETSATTCRAGRPTRDRAREKGNRTTTVLSRTTTASLAGRSSSMRRQRRRVMNSNRPYCRTNGCASFLEVDPITGTASCPICGFILRPH